MLCLLCAPCCAEESGQITFTFFQIESMRTDSIGDCCLIQFPNGETMLVDAMMPQCAPHLIRALREMGVERLDYLLVTHMHIDHIGGASAMISQMDVGRLLSPGVPYTTDTYRAFQAARAYKGLEEERLERGDTLEIGEVTLEVLNPLIDEALYQKFVNDTLTVAQTNQQSVVFMLTYGDFRALFTGDIYQEQERVLYKEYGDALACTLLKIPHHGSDSSGYKPFIKAASAEYAVAMGNTGMETWLYERYRRSGECAVYLTFLDGTVTVRADDRNTVTVTPEWTRDNYNYPL